MSTMTCQSEIQTTHAHSAQFTQCTRLHSIPSQVKQMFRLYRIFEIVRAQHWQHFSTMYRAVISFCFRKHSNIQQQQQQRNSQKKCLVRSLVWMSRCVDGLIQFECATFVSLKTKHSTKSNAIFPLNSQNRKIITPDGLVQWSTGQCTNNFSLSLSLIHKEAQTHEHQPPFALSGLDTTTQPVHRNDEINFVYLLSYECECSKCECVQHTLHLSPSSGCDCTVCNAFPSSISPR